MLEKAPRFIRGWRAVTFLIPVSYWLKSVPAHEPAARVPTKRCLATQLRSRDSSRRQSLRPALRFSDRAIDAGRQPDAGRLVERAVQRGGLPGLTGTAAAKAPMRGLARELGENRRVQLPVGPMRLYN